MTGAVSAVVRRDDELGAWRMWSRPADARLTAWGSPIRAYEQQRPAYGRHVTAASALLPVVIPLDHRHVVHDHAGRRHEVGAFVAGSHDVIGAVEADGFCGVQVDLSPVAAARILGDVRELAGTVAPLDAVVGAAGVTLVERLGNTAEPAARLDVLERFLLARFERGRAVDDLADQVWSRVAAGTTRVDELVDEVGWSARTLRRRVAGAFGLRPKRLARLVRFHRTLVRLEQDATTPLATVAVEHGYADQAHLTNEFTELAGTPPAALRAQRQPLGGLADSSKSGAGGPP